MGLLDRLFGRRRTANPPVVGTDEIDPSPDALSAAPAVTPVEPTAQVPVGSQAEAEIDRAVAPLGEAPADSAAAPDDRAVHDPHPFPSEEPDIAALVAGISDALRSHGLDLPLRPPADEAALDAMEDEIGFALPARLRDLWLLHDGQPDGAPGLIAGFPLLPTADAMANWRLWRDLGVAEQEDPERHPSTPAKAVRPLPWTRGWLPITEDGGGNHLGVDLDPGPRGTIGQIISFGRDDDRHEVYSASIDAHLARILHLLRTRQVIVKVDDDDFSGAGRWAVGDPDSPYPRRRDYTGTGSAKGAAVRVLLPPEDAVPAVEGTPAPGDEELPEILWDANPQGGRRWQDATSLAIEGLESFEVVPPLPLLRSMSAATRSAKGIDRFPALRDYEQWPLSQEGSRAAEHQDPDLTPLAALPELRELRVEYARYDFTGLSGCAKLASVRTTVYDIGSMNALASPPRLRTLWVNVSGFDLDLAAVDWSRFRGLTELNVSGSLGEDAASIRGDLAALGPLRKLRVLGVSDLTDSDVGALGGLPQLQHVQLRTTGPITGVEGIAAAPKLVSVAGSTERFELLRALRPELQDTHRVRD